MIHTLCAVCLLASTPVERTSYQDTTTYLEEVKVSAYFAEQPLLRLTTSAGVIGNNVLDQQPGTTLLPALNTVPGVRMEERSPGSYRLSLRGSLLRSPFGVRNVKVYWDEIPLTDAGGNTYLNLLDAGGMEGVEILKGPDGSLFGANSGGVAIIRPQGMGNADSTTASMRLNGGSYGLFHQQLAVDMNPTNTYRFAVNQTHQQADGYRENSDMKRTSVQTVQRWNYRPNSELRLLALYTDLRYRTPGGLTETQYAEDPRAARPATPVAPGAVEQQAGIINKTFVGGLVNDLQLGAQLRHVTAVFGTITDFTNPFITNYEQRDETNIGFRTYVDYIGGRVGSFSWHANAGMEFQYAKNDFYNYANQGGVRGEAMNFDALRSRQHFYFTRLSADLRGKLFIETSISLNHYAYRFRTVFPENQPEFTKRPFDAEWMPRAALSYLFTPQWAWRASVSRGYSPPTIEEVRPSDNVINTTLAAETGWNHETGFRWQTRNRRIFADGSVFYYRMADAIIRQLNDAGAESFRNAGGVHQLGAELSAVAWAITPRTSGWLRGLQLGTNVTLSRFRFGTYRVGDDDFSANKLTGVPAQVVVSNLFVQLPKQLSVYLMHNYTSSIPLDDANAFFADAYHLLQAKMTWNRSVSRKLNLTIFCGADNLLNQRYSLGNDINAFGGRFFNAAAPRNFYGGIGLRY